MPVNHTNDFFKFRYSLSCLVLSCLKQVGPTGPKKNTSYLVHSGLSCTCVSSSSVLFYWMFGSSSPSPSSKLESWGLLTNFRTCQTDHSKVSMVLYVIKTSALSLQKAGQIQTIWKASSFASPHNLQSGFISLFITFCWYLKKLWPVTSWTICPSWCSH